MLVNLKGMVGELITRLPVFPLKKCRPLSVVETSVSLTGTLLSSFSVKIALFVFVEDITLTCTLSSTLVHTPTSKYELLFDDSLFGDT